MRRFSNATLLDQLRRECDEGIVKLTCCKEYRMYSPKGDTLLHAHTTSCQTWNA